MIRTLKVGEVVARVVYRRHMLSARIDRLARRSNSPYLLAEKLLADRLQRQCLGIDHLRRGTT